MVYLPCNTSEYVPAPGDIKITDEEYQQLREAKEAEEKATSLHFALRTEILTKYGKNKHKKHIANGVSEDFWIFRNHHITKVTCVY